MKEITNEKMQELMENQEFAAKIRTAKSGEEMVKIFAEYDVQITEEELRESCKQTVDILREKGFIEGDELTEKGLELVSGGAKGVPVVLGLIAEAGGFMLAASNPIGWVVAGCGATLALIGCFI